MNSYSPTAVPTMNSSQPPAHGCYCDCAGKLSDDSPPDLINHPPHYTTTQMEPIDAIEGMSLGFHAGNVLKYLVRYKHKDGVRDLLKANWYLQRLIELETQGGDTDIVEECE